VSEAVDNSALVANELQSRLENGVLWLTINRADKGNAIPYYVRDALIDAFRNAHWDLEVRAVVLTAAGERHFCTGADLSVPQPQRGTKPAGAPDRVVGAAVNMMRAGFQQLMQAIQDCEKPVIVALNGTAAGGGSMLVLAADLVIAADSAKLIQVFVRRGLVPDGGVAYLLPRIVGMHKAKELMFFGVPAAELQDATKEWAERLANGPTKAIGWGKKLLHDASELSRHDLLEEEAMMVEMNSSTVDSGEGVASFRERRAPEWKGW
jgi:2-(1,2-epoxy-1,2-dihydrophenyl)acetyl-CoA isomerase